ncbi:MAG: RdgB/HAM1 family non-canonical purine NTP pyrophosphatase [Chitinispirillales bacterium]|jgi:XTP/dITP diphosphohydrolase|nr:RdgB/HAM1 family non-canonical purine NTP pyrophosphatase [Chitinispirillales bacterium]
MQKIIIATGNPGKVKEFRDMFSDMGLDCSVASLADCFDPLPDIEETGATFHENAKVKADWVYRRVANVWSLADDSGLEVDALDGAPGVLSARYSGEGANAARNNLKLLNELRGIPDRKRTARFKCVLVLRMGIDTYLSAEGVCEGRIGERTVGDKGFGYDPLFIPNGFDRTMAQLEPEEKNRISHRGMALRNLLAAIKVGGNIY